MKKMLVVSLLSVFVTVALAAIPSVHTFLVKNSQDQVGAALAVADGSGMPPACNKKVCTPLTVADGSGMPPACNKKVCTPLTVADGSGMPPACNKKVCTPLTDNSAA